jgi:hypothetical protein
MNYEGGEGRGESDGGKRWGRGLAGEAAGVSWAWHAKFRRTSDRQNITSTLRGTRQWSAPTGQSQASPGQREERTPPWVSIRQTVTPSRFPRRSRLRKRPNLSCYPQGTPPYLPNPPYLRAIRVSLRCSSGRRRGVAAGIRRFGDRRSGRLPG